MADSWLTITPTSGGSKTDTTSTILKITASQNTGAERTSTLVFQTSSGVSKTLTITQEVGEATYVAKINTSTTIIAAGGSYRFGDNQEIIIDKYIGDIWQDDVNPFENGLLVSAVSDSDWLRVTGYGSGKVNYYVDSRGTTTGSARTATVTFTFYNPEDKTKILTIDYPIVQEANSITKQTFVDFEFLPADLTLVDPDPSIYINPYSCMMDVYVRANNVYSSGSTTEKLLSGTDCEHFVVLNNVTFKSSTDTGVGTFDRKSSSGGDGMHLTASTAANAQTTGITYITIPGYDNTWKATSYVWTIPASVSNTGAETTYTAYRLIPQVQEIEKYTCLYTFAYQYVPWDYSGYTLKIQGIGLKAKLATSYNIYLTTVSSRTKTTLSSTSSYTNINATTIEDGLYDATPWTMYVSLPTQSATTTSSIRYGFYLAENSILCSCTATRTPYSSITKRYNTSSTCSTSASCSLTKSDTIYFTYLFSSQGSGARYLNVGSDTHFTIYYSYNGSEYVKISGSKTIGATTSNKCITFKIVANQTTSSGSTYISVNDSSTLNKIFTINISAAEVKKTIRTIGSLWIQDGNSSLEDDQYVGLLAETDSKRVLLGYGQYVNDGFSKCEISFDDSNITANIGNSSSVINFEFGRCYEDDDPTNVDAYELFNADGVENNALLSRFLSETDYENDSLYGEYYLSSDSTEQILSDQGVVPVEDGGEVWLFGNDSDNPFIITAQ